MNGLDKPQQATAIIMQKSEIKKIIEDIIWSNLVYCFKISADSILELNLKNDGDMVESIAFAHCTLSFTEKLSKGFEIEFDSYLVQAIAFVGMLSDGIENYLIAGDIELIEKLRSDIEESILYEIIHNKYTKERSIEIFKKYFSDN